MSRRVILRFLSNQNGAIWREGDLERVLEGLFTRKDRTPDLELSVYLVEAENAAELRAAALRVCAEHTASFTSRPGPMQYVLDVTEVPS